MTSTDLDPDPADDSPRFDPLMALTGEELATGSRQLKASVFKAITEGTQDYERALAAVVWLHARRTDPGASLGKFLRLPMTELSDALDAIGPDEAGPTTPPPAPS